MKKGVEGRVERSIDERVRWKYGGVEEERSGRMNGKKNREREG